MFQQQKSFTKSWFYDVSEPAYATEQERNNFSIQTLIYKFERISVFYSSSIIKKRVLYDDDVITIPSLSQWMQSDIKKG